MNLEKHLRNRQWIEVNSSNSSTRYFPIRLVSYNILAQDLMGENPALYQNCFKGHLSWNRRKERLFKELLRINADIICLQEMQEDHYLDDFNPRLGFYGYGSIYIKRSGNRPDGCAIFFNLDRLELMRSEPVPFYRPETRILDKDNCGLLALFQPRIRRATLNDLFCVATTHLLYSPTRGEVKIAQLQYFLAEIDRFARRTFEETSSCYPIILCGDFNAQPQSPLIDFLLQGSLKYDEYCPLEVSGQSPTSTRGGRSSLKIPSRPLLSPTFVTAECRFPDPRKPTPPSVDSKSAAILTHDKNFLSVYDPTDASQVTSNVNGDRHLVDYIFHTKADEESGRLTLLDRYELYDDDEVVDLPMPNHQFPSDHFLLAARFAFRLL